VGEGSQKGGQGGGPSSSGDDSAFDRLLHEAAKVSSPGSLLAPDTTLCEGRFVVQRRIGEGGMGVVVEALDTRTDTRVALKTLSRVDADGIYRMKHEFRSLAGQADFLRGQLAAARGRRDEALSHFERAVEADGNSPLAHARFVHQTRLGDLLGAERGAQLCATLSGRWPSSVSPPRGRQLWATRLEG